MSVDWGRKEQQTLEEALSKFPAEKHSALDRFIRVASLLPDKGVRDVALRVRWMSRKEQGKRRKTEVDGGVGKKTGGRREGRAEKQSIFAMRPPAMPASGSQQQQQQQQQQQHRRRRRRRRRHEQQHELQHEQQHERQHVSR